jgi:hypothetical protein
MQFESLITSFVDELEKIAGSAPEPNPYNSTCPVCSRPAVSTCRCRIGNKRCANGHDWHYEKAEDGGRKVVLGTGHDLEKAARRSVNPASKGRPTVTLADAGFESVQGPQKRVVG